MQVSHLFSGALAGLGATIPMTVAMEVLHRSLPQHERYPLPPREITEKLTIEAGLREHLDEEEHVGLSLLSHFSYGAAAGAAYAALVQKYDLQKHSLPPALGGTAFGLALWVGSYLGWLPAAGILRPATEHPPRRNGLMLTAHAVWGSVLGILVDRFQGQPSEEVRTTRPRS